MQNPHFDVATLDDYKVAGESYQLIDHIFYLHAPDGIGRSKLVGHLEKCLGRPLTGRNLNTIKKLLALCNEIS